MPEVSDFERARARRWVDRFVAQLAAMPAGLPPTLSLVSAALRDLHAAAGAGTLTEETLAAIAEEIAARGGPEVSGIHAPPSRPVAPDFNTMALRLLVELGPLANDQNPEITQQAMRLVAEQLRVVWNARGAADLAELDAALAGASPSIKMVDHTIRSLDR
jgi:hypothetical protein